jgi:hypothetical protein
MNPGLHGKRFHVSWTEIFPVLDDSMIEDYEASVTTAEREQFEEWFGVYSVHPAGNNSGQPGSHPAMDKGFPAGKESVGPRQHLVSATLFWKHVNGADADLPVPTRKNMTDSIRLGLVKRFAPWESYVEPLMLWTPEAVRANPDVRFRLYLASDLKFLVDELTAVGWEAWLMKSPSIRYCPGGFWRFLALEEEGALVTVIDTDRMREVSHEIGRTRAMAQTGLGLWRVPGYYNSDLRKQVRYRPILGGHFGARGGVPVRKLIEAFLWHSARGSLRKTAFVPGIGERPIQFSKWPSYGFDEWFQLAALYPWLAPRGTLSFIPSDAMSLLLPADLEYALWANPRSESIYF